MSGKLGKRLAGRLLLAFALVTALGGQAFAITARADESAQENSAPQAERAATGAEEQLLVAESDAAVDFEAEQEPQASVEKQAFGTESNAENEPVAQVRAVSDTKYSGGNTGKDKWGNTKSLYWVLSGETVEIPGSSNWRSDSLLTHNQNSTTWTAGSVDVLQKIYLNGNDFKDADAQVIILPRTAKANIYLRYDNTVPNTLVDYQQGEYGPAGDNSSYFQITVDIKQMLDNGCKPYLYNGSSVSGQAYVYFSFASANGKDDEAQNDERRTFAISYWKDNIETFLSVEDQQIIIDKFGKDQYFGYVFKYEGLQGYGGVWHIDGSLQKNPPNYVVELYHVDAQSDVLFVCNDGEPGVKYQDFVTRLTQELATLDGGTITDVQLANYDVKGATVTYKKDGIPYERTITPLTTGTAGAESAIRPSTESFSYKEMTKDTYYLCQLEISDPVVKTGTLSITKKVSGSIANVDQHFEFQLECEVLKGEQFDNALIFTYTGDSDKEDTSNTQVHGPMLKFDKNTGLSDVIQLKHDETVTITLPAGCEVTVKETGLSGNAGTSVTATVDGQPALTNPEITSAQKEVALENPVEIDSAESHKVGFTNIADLQPNTAVNLNATPMVGLFTVAAIGGAALFASGREKRGADARKE